MDRLYIEQECSEDAPSFRMAAHAIQFSTSLAENQAGQLPFLTTGNSTRRRRRRSALQRRAPLIAYARWQRRWGSQGCSP